MRKFNVNVNGKTYAVEVEETEGGAMTPVSVTPASAVPTPAPQVSVPSGGTEVKSPMPGLVLELSVANGATVKKGDKIVVLEAMKMQNDIFAPAAGTITFAVKQGDSVETAALLASIK